MSERLGDNKLSPLLIPDARDAQYKASEYQRGVADQLAGQHRDLADKERRYRVALTARIKQLHEDGMAITTCENVAKGEDSIATLRKERDEAKGDLAKVQQLAFVAGADRRALDGLIEWSMHRDLRTDAPPVQYEKPIGVRAA